MATILKASIASGSVAAGATVVLAHTLNIDGVGRIPDEVQLDNAAFSVVGTPTPTSITVQNNSGAAASVNVLVEFWYSANRVFGSSAVTSLIPRPFLPVAPQLDSPEYIFPGEPQVIRYVRSASGNDNNDGLSPATAWQTFNKGLGFLAGFSTNRSKTLDVSDSVFSASEQINFPALFGGVNGDLDFAGVGPNNFFYRTIGQIRAAQTLQQALTVTMVTADPDTELITLTVSETLTINAHVGQLVIGSGLAEYGTVRSNTANTLVLSTINTSWTAPVGAYLPSTTMTFGDGGFFQQAAIASLFAQFTFQGISFLGNGTQAALTLFPSMPFNMQLCQVQGFVVEGGAGLGIVDACYFTRRVAQNGSAVTYRSSFFDACDFNHHGDGATGLGGYQGCMFDACAPVASGNFESRMGVSLDNCEISNGTAQGVIVRGANVNLIRDTRIRDCAADGILADASVRLQLSGVVGTGNVGHGARLQNGAQVNPTGGTSVTGTIGDVELGGGGTVGWAAAPATDVGAGAPQFCRIF